jgi:hypothetical protein
MRGKFLCVLSGLALALPLHAGEVLPPANQRFAKATTAEVPRFQRHVVPLLGRLGCNGRACHGSFQGQGGFRLSLFGYDFQADHKALLAGDPPRVNLEDPPESQVLLKPTRTIPHGGGQRMKPGGWEYHLLLRWIQAGARGVHEEDPAFADLVVEPEEVVFSKAGETARLKVTARWADGSREDVTPLCRFRSNDESVATVSDSGVVTAAGKGDTHVVAFYDNGIVPVPVLLPVSDRMGEHYPDVPTPTEIDRHVVAKLRKLGIVPSPLCTDAEFLRRLSLDMTGTLPTPDEAAVFLADTSSDKRGKKIDELLERPAYAAWWATRLCDLTGNSEQNLPVGGEQGLRREKAGQWYHWIHRRVAENTPYDKLVEGIVLATSRRPGQSDDAYFAEMSSYFRTDRPTDFSARSTMPYFWSRGRFSPPQTLRFSYAFLGIRLECAQCHKHPYDQWTKDDHDQFRAFFDGIRFTVKARARAQELKGELGLTMDQDSGGYKRLFAKLVKEGKTVPWGEVVAPDWRRSRGKKVRRRKGPAGRVLTPKLLGGEKVLAEHYADPREPVMEWLRQKDNPYFARAFVNRVWASYFSVGIIDPPDDMNLANPPSNKGLLDHLAREFVAHSYDMKWLHRTIANSRTYQLSWRPNDTNKLDERTFSHAGLRRLPAEVAYDALVLATASDEARKALDADPVGKRSIGVSSCYDRPAVGSRYALALFGKPPRASTCDCERSGEPSLLQTVYLRNDQEVLKLLDRRDGWLAQVRRAKVRDPRALIRQAYLRTLGRLPYERERAVARRYLDDAADPAAGLRDLLWALVNTKEFIINR